MRSYSVVPEVLILGVSVVVSAWVGTWVTLIVLSDQVLLALVALGGIAIAAIVPTLTVLLQWRQQNQKFALVATKEEVAVVAATATTAVTVQAETKEVVDKVEKLVNSESERIREVMATMGEVIDTLRTEIARVSLGGAPTPQTGEEAAPVTVDSSTGVVSVEKPPAP